MASGKRKQSQFQSKYKMLSYRRETALQGAL